MKTKRIVLLVLAIIIVVGGIYGYRLYHRPPKDRSDEKGIVINARRLVAAYTANEHSSDSIYLDKTIDVSGTIAEWGANDAGQATALFKSDDPMASVFCTFKDKDIHAKAVGDSITVKGVCSGLVGDVKLTDCILKK